MMRGCKARKQIIALAARQLQVNRPGRLEKSSQQTERQIAASSEMQDPAGPKRVERIVIISYELCR